MVSSFLLLYLAAAGVGTLGIIDHDVLEVSNLQRQVLYKTEALGQPKAHLAKLALLDLNPHIQVNAYPYYFDSSNAMNYCAKYDIIADCSDNYATRYLANEVCVALKKPFVYASIFEFTGQCAFFYPRDEEPCFRCLFRTMPNSNERPNCAETGVLGVLPGLLGTIQATEILKYLLNQGTLLEGKLLLVDLLKMVFKTFSFSKDKTCPECSKEGVPMQQTITARDLKQTLETHPALCLVDVRSALEHAQFNIGGLLLPLDELPNHLSELNPEAEIVVYCERGMRSERAAAFLRQHQFQKVRSLEGGMQAWRSYTSTIPQ